MNRQRHLLRLRRQSEEWLFTLMLISIWGFASCGGTNESTNPEVNKDGAEESANSTVKLVEVSPATGEEVLQAVRQSDAKVVLVNVWATWCEPCREEFPDILRLRRKLQVLGLEVIFVSGDFNTEMRQVVAFLAQHGVDFPTLIKAGNDTDFINTLNPEWSGALPATFIYDAQGSLQHFWQGKATYTKFEQKVLEVLGK